MISLSKLRAGPGPNTAWIHEPPASAVKITLPNSIWAWQFPKAPGLVGYATRGGTSLLAKSKIVWRFRIESTNGVTFGAANDDTPPCHVRPYFQRAGDQGTAQYEYYRWWGNAFVVPLGVGSFAVEAVLDPAKWGSVFGKTGAQAPTQWTAALSNVARLGFTFGGKSFAGHGVYAATGAANFALEAFDAV